MTAWSKVQSWGVYWINALCVFPPYLNTHCTHFSTETIYTLTTKRAWATQIARERLRISMLILSAMEGRSGVTRPKIGIPKILYMKQRNGVKLWKTHQSHTVILQFYFTRSALNRRPSVPVAPHRIMLVIWGLQTDCTPGERRVRPGGSVATCRLLCWLFNFVPTQRTNGDDGEAVEFNHL